MKRLIIFRGWWFVASHPNTDLTKIYLNNAAHTKLLRSYFQTGYISQHANSSSLIKWRSKIINLLSGTTHRVDALLRDAWRARCTCSSIAKARDCTSKISIRESDPAPRSPETRLTSKATMNRAWRGRLRRAAPRRKQLLRARSARDLFNLSVRGRFNLDGCRTVSNLWMYVELTHLRRDKSRKNRIDTRPHLFSASPFISVKKDLSMLKLTRNWSNCGQWKWIINSVLWYGKLT